MAIEIKKEVIDSWCDSLDADISGWSAGEDTLSSIKCSLSSVNNCIDAALSAATSFRTKISDVKSVLTIVKSTYDFEEAILSGNSQKYNEGVLSDAFNSMSGLDFNLPNYEEYTSYVNKYQGINVSFDENETYNIDLTKVYLTKKDAENHENEVQKKLREEAFKDVTLEKRGDSYLIKGKDGTYIGWTNQEGIIELNKKQEIPNDTNKNASRENSKYNGEVILNGLSSVKKNTNDLDDFNVIKYKTTQNLNNNTNTNKTSKATSKYDSISNNSLEKNESLTEYLKNSKQNNKTTYNNLKDILGLSSATTVTKSFPFESTDPIYGKVNGKSNSLLETVSANQIKNNNTTNSTEKIKIINDPIYGKVNGKSNSLLETLNNDSNTNNYKSVELKDNTTSSQTTKKETKNMEEAYSKSENDIKVAQLHKQSKEIYNTEPAEKEVIQKTVQEKVDDIIVDYRRGSVNIEKDKNSFLASKASRTDYNEQVASKSFDKNIEQTVNSCQGVSDQLASDNAANGTNYSMKVSCFTNGSGHVNGDDNPTHYAGAKADVRFYKDGVEISPSSITEAEKAYFREVLEDNNLGVQYESQSGVLWGDTFLLDGALNYRGEPVSYNGGWGTDNSIKYV